MTPKSIILGYRGNNDRILNHVFNLAKYYIFVTKYRERTLNFEVFKSKISYSYNLEKNIAQRSSNKRLDLHKRWHLLYNIVENAKYFEHVNYIRTSFVKIPLL